MKFAEFLKIISDKSFQLQPGILCFTSSIYPPFFFEILFKKISTTKPTLIHLSSQSMTEIKIILTQSVLGKTQVFWFSDISEATKIRQKTFFDYITKYTGPNTVIFFSTTISTCQNIISLENSINKTIFKQLVHSLYPQATKKMTYVFNNIFSKITTIDINSVCKLFYYVEFMSSKELDQSISYVLSMITSSDHSLFSLTESFFSLNKKKFFTLWSILGKKYPPMFWLSFWSKQIWNAYYTRLYLEQKNFVAAKKISFRLPHSFINKTWKNFSLSRLQSLHKNLYNIDFSIKKGSLFYSLDLFYITHFIRGNGR